MIRGAFDGITVLDFTQGIAGPHASMLLALHGGMAHAGDYVTPALYFRQHGIATVAYDLCGNSSTWEQIIDVRDTVRTAGEAVPGEFRAALRDRGVDYVVLHRDPRAELRWPTGVGEVAVDVSAWEARYREWFGAPVADEVSCLPNGMPAQMRPPAQLPIQILETPGQVTVLFEYFGVFRNIYLNEKMPEEPDPAFMGTSVGHWEGDTLVVETIALHEQTRVFNVPHSDQLRLVERMRRTGPDTMEDRITMTDPAIFTRPWTWVVKLKKVPGMKIMEYICVNERNDVLADGSTGVKLQSSGQ